jgi:hypothetical protein
LIRNHPLANVPIIGQARMGDGPDDDSFLYYFFLSAPPMKVVDYYAMVGIIVEENSLGSFNFVRFDTDK